MYTTVDAVKRALQLHGREFDEVIRRKIEAASDTVDRLTYRRFLPRVATRVYDSPLTHDTSNVLFLDDDLLELRAVRFEGSPVDLSGILMEPTSGPPYTRLRFLDSFPAGRHSIEIDGLWGYPYGREPVAKLPDAISAGSSDIVVDRLVEIGATLQIDDEYLIVTARTRSGLGAQLTSPLVADTADDTLAFTPGVTVYDGEILTLQNERMLVVMGGTGTATVRRAYDGTVLRDHPVGTDLYADRSLTVRRGANGSTAAGHAANAVVERLRPAGDVEGLAQAIAVARLSADRTGWTGEIGASGEQTVETRFRALSDYIDRVVSEYRRGYVGAV
jgi:hypothetical protein